MAGHPLDESTHRSLIAALDRSGDRAGAVQAYEQCRSVLGEHLGIDPSAETVQVYLEALRDQPGGAPARVPAETSSFIGREADLAALAGAVSGPGLVTVTGKGGVGKSRLAVRVASRRGGFDGGRLWVPLAAVAEDALVASSVALEIGVQLGIEDAALAVADHLAPLGRVLLVLDGCEGVVDGAASLVAALLARAPLLTIVATSRVPLSVDGERLVPLDPASHRRTPPRACSAAGRYACSPTGCGSRAATCASTRTPRRTCSRCAVGAVACRSPWNWSRPSWPSMPAGDLLDHLQDVLGEAGGLRSIARSSYLLLDTDEAAVFRRMAVLDGPVGLQLVRQVVSGDGIAPVRVVRILRELTARGLLVGRPLRAALALRAGRRPAPVRPRTAH